MVDPILPQEPGDMGVETGCSRRNHVDLLDGRGQPTCIDGSLCARLRRYGTPPPPTHTHNTFLFTVVLLCRHGGQATATALLGRGR